MSKVSLRNSTSSFDTLQSAANALGNGVELIVDGYSTVVATVNITATATVTFEGTEDGTIWVPLSANRSGTDIIASTAVNTAQNGAYTISVAGYQKMRARISAFTSGTVTVTAHASPQAGLARAINANIVAGSATIGSVSVTSVVPGVASSSLGKAEDSIHASGDTGVAAWGVRNDNAATTYGANNDYIPRAADAKGRTIITQKAATATASSVASSATSVTLLAANTERAGATISNDSSAILYVKMGATASTTSYTIKLNQDGYYEVPFGYTGIIDGIWASATGSARVTEIV